MDSTVAGERAPRGGLRRRQGLQGVVGTSSTSVGRTIAGTARFSRGTPAVDRSRFMAQARSERPSMPCSRHVHLRVAPILPASPAVVIPVSLMGHAPSNTRRSLTLSPRFSLEDQVAKIEWLRATCVNACVKIVEVVIQR